MTDYIYCFSSFFSCFFLLEQSYGLQQLAAGQPAVPPGNPLNPTQWEPTAIYLSTDGGTTWARVSGLPGTDDHDWLNGVDADPTANPDFVTFELANGATLMVPRYVTFSLSFEAAKLYYYDELTFPHYMAPNGLPTWEPADPDKVIFYVNDNKQINCFVRGTGIDPAKVEVTTRVVNYSREETVIPSVSKGGEGEYRIDLTPVNNLGNSIRAYHLLVSATDDRGNTCTYDLSLKNFLGGGTIADPTFYISTPEELAYVARKVNAGHSSYKDAYYVLENDIDLSAYPDWTPIGTPEHPFTGIFYGYTNRITGKGPCISGLKVTSATQYAGLFGYVKNASITSLTLVSPQVTATGGFCGALAGYAEYSDPGNTQIANCYVAGGSCTAAHTVGGLIGGTAGKTGIDKIIISNCHVKDIAVEARDAAATYSHAGGLIGTVRNTALWQCSATGISLRAAKPGCGGLVGSHDMPEGMRSVSEIISCYSTGNIVKSNGGAGALLGSHWGIDAATILTGSYSSCTLGEDMSGLLPEEFTLTGEVKGSISIVAAYYLTSLRPEGTELDVIYQPAITQEMIDKMNNAAGVGAFNDDGTLTGEKWITP